MKKKIILAAEWIDYLNCYRLYQPSCPDQTVAYVDNIEEAETGAKEHGYLLNYVKGELK